MPPVYCRPVLHRRREGSTFQICHVASDSSKSSHGHGIRCSSQENRVFQGALMHSQTSQGHIWLHHGPLSTKICGARTRAQRYQVQVDTSCTIRRRFKILQVTMRQAMAVCRLSRTVAVIHQKTVGSMPYSCRFYPCENALVLAPSVESLMVQRRRGFLSSNKRCDGSLRTPAPALLLMVRDLGQKQLSASFSARWHFILDKSVRHQETNHNEACRRNSTVSSTPYTWT